MKSALVGFPPEEASVVIRLGSSAKESSGKRLFPGHRRGQNLVCDFRQTAELVLEEALPDGLPEYALLNAFGQQSKFHIQLKDFVVLQPFCHADLLDRVVEPFERIPSRNVVKVVAILFVGIIEALRIECRFLGERIVRRVVVFPEWDEETHGESERVDFVCDDDVGPVHGEEVLNAGPQWF